MTFEDRQKEIFFDSFHHVSAGDLTQWVDKDAVLKWAGTKITARKADDLFFYFTDAIKYVEENDKKKYRLSDSGKIYYEFLKKESKKYDLDAQSVQSTIDTGVLTRKNIRVGWLLGVMTFIAIAANLYITICKDKREKELQKTQSLKKGESQLPSTTLIQFPQEISLSLKDTAKVKVKIEK